MPLPPIVTLFPYTTLFRSDRSRGRRDTGRPVAAIRGELGGSRARRGLDHPPFLSVRAGQRVVARVGAKQDRKSTRLNSSHLVISSAVFCLKKKKVTEHQQY